jgi:hypothetical protein
LNACGLKLGTSEQFARAVRFLFIFGFVWLGGTNRRENPFQKQENAFFCMI